MRVQELPRESVTLGFKPVEETQSLKSNPTAMIFPDVALKVELDIAAHPLIQFAEMVFTSPGVPEVRLNFPI